MSGINKIAISLAVLDWRTRLRPGVCLEVLFTDFIGTEEVFLESVEFTSLTNDLTPTPTIFITLVKSLATDFFEYAVSWEQLDIVSSKV